MKCLILVSNTSSQSKTVKLNYLLTIILNQLVSSWPIVIITISFKYISAYLKPELEFKRGSVKLLTTRVNQDA